MLCAIKQSQKRRAGEAGAELLTSSANEKSEAFRVCLFEKSRVRSEVQEVPCLHDPTLCS